MEIFNAPDYRKAIKTRAKDVNIRLSEVAARTRIHPSYLSRALLGKASLSNDQVFRICTLLNLTRVEVDYLLMLRERDESGDKVYRNYLDGRINETKKTQLELLRRISPGKDGSVVSDLSRDSEKAGLSRQNTTAEYYLDMLNAAVHMYLCIGRFRKQPQLIASILGITSARLQDCLTVLQRCGFIAWEKGGLKVNKQVVHLAEGDPSLRSHHINWRLEAIQSLQRTPLEATNNYSMSSCFSCTGELALNIKEKFKQFVAAAQKTIVDHHEDQPASEGGVAESVYFLNFDLRELKRV